MRAVLVLLVATSAMTGTTLESPRVFIEDAPTFVRFTDAEIRILEKLNRADRVNLKRLSRIVVPTNFGVEALQFSPMPQADRCAVGLPKLIVVHLPSQVFGAYEYGALVRWGPVSSGRQKHPTPSGIFNLNWKSRARHSTDDPDWYMEWYFNFHNQRGLAFHQYSLPGRPASHACIRLLARDALWLYEWGEKWILSSDRQEVVTPGTPVYIEGEYQYNAPPPWLKPAWWRTPIAIALPESLCSHEPAVPLSMDTILR